MNIKLDENCEFKFNNNYFNLIKYVLEEHLKTAKEIIISDFDLDNI